MKNQFIFTLIASSLLLYACAPEQRCYRDDDCAAPLICNAYGECDYKCHFDTDCGTSFACIDHVCTIKKLIPDDPVDDPTKDPVDDPTKDHDPVFVEKFVCPDDMSPISDAYCIDMYEASRPDADETTAGYQETRAVSQKGVMPWLIGDNNEKAEKACAAAGKRLCSPAEWEYACHGVNNTVYGYGDKYNPVICNGLDTYPYPGFHLMPTGSFSDCHNGWNVFDMSGNVWEHTAGGSGMTVRGGAYNCSDSENNHKCSYVPMTWTPAALGFRCCANGSIVEVEVDEADNNDEKPQAHLLLNQGNDEILLAWLDASSDTASDFSHDFSSNSTNEPCLEPQEAISTASSLWDYPDSQRDAIDLLKAAKACNAPNQDLTRALGIAYARMENYPWALRTLAQLNAQYPDDCETTAWMAWIQIQMAMPDEAKQTIASQKTCESSALQARMQLLDAMASMTNNKKKEAQSAIDNAAHQEAMTKSDLKALESMQTTLGIQSAPNLSWKIQLDGGYASNAMSGSPSDPSLNGKDLDSPFIDGDIRFTLDPWKDAFARPVLEGQFTGEYLTSEDTKTASYIDLSMRLGAQIDSDSLKFSAWYRPESLILDGGDKYNKGPVQFYLSHRIELDFEILKWLYIFTGYGHRTFRQMVRTRDEFDIGAGARHPLGLGFALTWGATYRHWFSTGDMYDLNGINLSLALDYRIPSHDILFRLNGSFSLDDYADSKGYFEQDAARRDYAARGTFQVWSPSWAGVRVGAQFKASRRWSTADDYDFVDYRGMISVKWTGALSFYGPKSVKDNAFSIPWNFDTEENTERIRDIIKQDEDMQRSSSCLQN